jgi:hypothetical protein
MPRGKEFCPLENDYFPSGEFKVIDGTRVHDVEPLHRASDGVLVEEEDPAVIPVMDIAFSTTQGEAL